MIDLKLASFDAITFDFYGTIVNWEPEILDFLRHWTGDQGATFADSDLLELYDRLRQPIQNERPIHPYPEVLKRTLDQLACELDCELSESLRNRFADLATTHQAFHDSVDTLRKLKQRGLQLGVLSNIDNNSFSAILERLGLEFDVTVTAQRVGAYKPDKAHFNAMLADFQARNISIERILHVAQSRRADIVPASELGLSCVWVDRPGHRFGRTGAGAENAVATYRVSSLQELLDY